MNSRRKSWATWAVVALCAIAAANAGLAALASEPPADPSSRAPARLHDTGLYRADGSIDPQNRPFSPQYPLWTDGASKRRWVRLPAGSTIDVRDADAWVLPVGTTLWKEFAWNGKKVETRMLRRETNGEWTYASYVWNETQTEAVLAPSDGVPGAFEVAAGKRHSIPAIADCASCHRSAPSQVLGFNALQLSDDRDPNAPHAEPLPRGAVTLRTLIDESLFSPAHPEWAATPPRIRERDPIARAAIGYLSTNCGTCHNDRGPLARLGFSLRHDVADAHIGAPEPAHATAVGGATRYAIPGVSQDSTALIVPGAPGRSAVFARMRSRRPAAQMPPLGTVVRDSVAVELVRRWIEGLAPASTADRVARSSARPGA